MYKDFLKKCLKVFKEYESPVSTLLGMLVVFGMIGVIGWYVTLLRKTELSDQQPAQTVFEASPTPSPLPPTVEALPTSVIVIERDGQYFVQGLPVIYVVQQGNTLPQIAEAFYKSSENQIDILRENNLATGLAIVAGQQLVIPNVPTRLAREIIEREK